MNESDTKKLITGYILGGFIFLILIPFLIYLISFVSLKTLGFHIPLVRNIGYSVATFLAVAGGVFVIWSNIDLFTIGKGGPTDFFNKPISPRSKKLVIKGPYEYTRNPMVFGMNALYIAFSIILNSLSAVLFCLIFLLVMTFYIKQTEEKRLQKDFGDEYLNYKKKVSMIIPFPSKKGIPSS